MKKFLTFLFMVIVFTLLTSCKSNEIDSVFSDILLTQTSQYDANTLEETPMPSNGSGNNGSIQTTEANAYIEVGSILPELENSLDSLLIVLTSCTDSIDVNIEVTEKINNLKIDYENLLSTYQNTIIYSDQQSYLLYKLNLLSNIYIFSYYNSFEGEISCNNLTQLSENINLVIEFLSHIRNSF